MACCCPPMCRVVYWDQRSRHNSGMQMSWKAEVHKIEPVKGVATVSISFKSDAGESFTRDVPLAEIPEGNVARYVRGTLIRLEDEDKRMAAIEVGPVG
jgi:hypothetical protein